MKHKTDPILSTAKNNPLGVVDKQLKSTVGQDPDVLAFGMAQKVHDLSALAKEIKIWDVNKLTLEDCLVAAEILSDKFDLLDVAAANLDKDIDIFDDLVAEKQRAASKHKQGQSYKKGKVLKLIKMSLTAADTDAFAKKNTSVVVAWGEHPSSPGFSAKASIFSSLDDALLNTDSFSAECVAVFNTSSPEAAATVAKFCLQFKKRISDKQA